MLALVDGDCVAYRCAASAEHDSSGLAVWRTNELMETILRDVGATHWEVYLTGRNNFRYTIFPEYKANRLFKPKPQHLEACRQCLIDNWNAQVVDGEEADDRLGIRQTQIRREVGLID